MKSSEIKLKICRELGISSFAYNQTMFTSGEDYLLYMANGWEEVFKLLFYNAKFWEWWNNQFYLADLRVLSYDMPFDLNYWVDYHSPESCMTYPDAEVFDSSYELMINNVKMDLVN